MKDLLGQEIKVKDTVVYVYLTKQGKQDSVKGIVRGFNNKGVIIDTQKGRLNVKNIIKIKSANRLLDMVRSLVVR